MIRLLEPSMAHFDSWAAAVGEFDGAHVDGSGLPAGYGVDRATCETLINKQRQHSDVSRPLPSGLVHCDYYWIADIPSEEQSSDGDGDAADATIVGFIALRHTLNDFLSVVGGHIGYSVRPSRRRQGIASSALAMVLDHARDLGLGRVLITCDDDNEASARTIESAGGRLQDVQDRPAQGYGLVRRYWIDL